MKAVKILVVDDEKMIRWTICEALKEWSFVPIEASNVLSAIELFNKEQPPITLLDINLPDGSGLDVLQTIKAQKADAVVIMINANVKVEHTIAALRSGAFDFITKPIDFEKLRGAVENGLASLQPTDSASRKIKDSDNNFGFDEIIGKSSEMVELIQLARKIAKRDVTSILLQGESGTGKDLIAKAIHNSSPRGDKPFVAINCAAIPENLIESELFGFEKGAFTDAKSAKEGLFEQAKGGTIFLDEIGEMELGLQAKLLRVLEEGVFRRVGGLKDLKLNASVIAASNRNLREESEAGNFRQDLYFRLSVIELNIPPLRDRGEDILLLADYFITKFDQNRPHKKSTRSLAPEVVELFLGYPWVGNVRELRNAIERALILEEGKEISLKYLPLNLSQHSFSSSSNGSGLPIPPIYLPPKGISLEEVENSLIEQALHRTQGNVTRAGKLLNLSRDQMRYHLKKRRNENTD